MAVPFAFYGRVSTEDRQDPVSSKEWQLRISRQLIEPHGVIVAEYFDIGQSRAVPWRRRPEAARLLEALENPDRGFRAVVVGEPQRAFSGNEYHQTLPVLTNFGVELWVPEVGGAADPDSEAHDILMGVFGGIAKGERTRMKSRVTTAMAAQVHTEGRFQGGRPPFGFRLVDAGPHPNPAKAADGLRRRRLAEDPATAPVVRRMFEEYVAGRGYAAIAEGLTRDGIPSPSAHDPARNPHRSSSAGIWAKSAVRSILRNPRYTGYEVWNRQPRNESLIDFRDPGKGYTSKQSWAPEEAWITSAAVSHDVIVPEGLFAAAAARGAESTRASHRSRRKNLYLLASLVTCGLCGRRMSGSWNHEHAYYRCKFSMDYPQPASSHPRTVYVRERALVEGLDEMLAESLIELSHKDTVDALVQASLYEDRPAQARSEAARKTIAECDRKLGRYRQALEEDGDLPTVLQWIKEVQAEKLAAKSMIQHVVPARSLRRSDAEALLGDTATLVSALKTATAAQKAALYGELGVSLTYYPEGRVDAEVRPACTHERVGGGT